MHIFYIFKVILNNFIEDDDDDDSDDDDDDSDDDDDDFLEANNWGRFLNAFRTTLRDEHV